MKKQALYNVVCCVLLFMGMVQITHTMLTFYNVRKNASTYEKCLIDVNSKCQNSYLAEKINNKVIELTTFLKSYDLVYYFSFLYSITLIIISILLFKFIDGARIAAVYYLALSLFYTPFIIILREINGNKLICFYQEINGLMAEYSQNDYTAFQSIINNWHQFQVERFAANICISTFLTTFYLFLIYFFSRKTSGKQAGRSPETSGKKQAGRSPNKRPFMF